MIRKKYTEKLKDPQWQKKRLEILQRDNWTCKGCGDNKSTLHVHHKKYIFGRDPWEYENNMLITLCEFCHTREEQLKDSPGIAIIATHTDQLNVHILEKITALEYLRLCEPKVYNEVYGRMQEVINGKSNGQFNAFIKALSDHG